MGRQPSQFRYWVDELLWSQGRTATIQLEEVLDAIGGVRTGGPHKLLSSSKGSSPVSSVLDLQQLQQDLEASVPSAPTVAGESSKPLQATPAGGQAAASTQQASSSSGSELHAALNRSKSTPEGAGVAVAAAAYDAADVSSDIDSSGGMPASALAKRPDDSLLGYHHVRKWDLLWTKSVYAIKAARQLQPGQLVSAIAGLNCLTMKKRMIQTLRMVSTSPFLVLSYATVTMVPYKQLQPDASQHPM